MKWITIVGARPQFIKASAVSRALSNIPEIQEVIVHTGQHYDQSMSDVFFTELGISEPSYNLGVGSGGHGYQTGNMLIHLEDVFLNEKPDWVIVYGDTNSTLAGALTAAKLHIPVAHIEAGLRSFNRQMPEEVNRVLTDHVSTVLYAPTEIAVENLRQEGIPQSAIRQVGDVMYDAALFFAEKASAHRGLVEQAGLSPGSYFLATIHRAENTDNPDRLAAIFSSLMKLHETLPVVLPLHPRTRKALSEMGLMDKVAATLRLLPPVGYLDMLNLEKNASVIITDSGGVQKEAFFQRVPCITLRQETEWVELVKMGWNRLVDPTLGEERILSSILSMFQQKPPIETDQSSHLYGGGSAAQDVVAHLNYLGTM